MAQLDLTPSQQAMVKTLEAMLAKGTKIAAAALEAGESDIENSGEGRNGRSRAAYQPCHLPSIAGRLKGYVDCIGPRGAAN